MTRAFLGSQFWECSWEGMLPKLDGDDGGSQFVQELFCYLLPIFRPLWFKMWRSPIGIGGSTLWDTETEGGATPRSRKTWVETHRNSADLHWVHVNHLMPDCSPEIHLLAINWSKKKENYNRTESYIPKDCKHLYTTTYQSGRESQMFPFFEPRAQHQADLPGFLRWAASDQQTSAPPVRLGGASQ